MKKTLENVWSFASAKLQAKRHSLLAFIVLIAIIGFAVISMIGCPAPDDSGKKTIDSIKITAKPTKTMYIIGEELDTTGMVVTATYSDGTTEVIDNSKLEINGFDSSTVGEKTITVSYQGKTAEFKVNVYQEDNLPDLESIEITTLPTKTRYNLGEDLDLTGMVVKATYTGGATQEVTDYEVSGYDKDTAGRQTITVTYEDKTDEFSVNVIDPNKPTVTISASHEAGTYNEVISVVLTAVPADAVIYYTLDGTEPTEESDVYTTAISISETTTIKAFAVKEGNNDSNVLVAEYILIFTFNSPPVLTLEAENGKITYTWTASDPAADSYDVYYIEGSGKTAAEVKAGTKITGATSGGEITGLTNGTEYSVIVTANKTGYVSIDSDVETAIPSPPYIITGSGATFTAKKSGVIVGTADQPIQTVIDAIRGDAKGKACIIRFGDGETALDIGTASASFNNDGDSTWGAVELTGKITGNSATATSGTIVIGNDVSVNSIADIANTTATGYNSRAVYHSSTGTLTISGGEIKAAATSGRAVHNASSGTITISGGTVSAISGYAVSIDYYGNGGTVTITGGTVSTTTGRAVFNESSSGTVNISGGTVQATTGYAVYNYNSGTVNISGGTFQATSGYAVFNDSLGAVNISGGTVSATTGYAVYNNSNGKITVSQAAGSATKITSANVTDTQGTIYLRDNNTYTDERLIISGGIVENTGDNGRVIYNDSTGAVTISGGTVQATGSGTVYSVYSANAKPGALNMTIPPAVIVGNTYPRLFTAAPALTLAPDSGKITYTWTASTPAPDSYDVYWKAGNGLSAAEVKTGTRITGAASGGSITGLTDGTAYSVAVTAYKKTSSNIDSIDSAVLTVKPGVSAYIITGSGTSFTVTKGGATVGTANQPIQTVINAIKTDANGAASFIQFGDGNTPLNIGTASVSFSNATGSTWGAVELTGKITSAVSGTASGTIVIDGSGTNATLTSGADIANTAAGSDGRAVYYNSSNRPVTISGGTVSANTGVAVYNNSTGTVTISGGTVSGNTGFAVYNASTGKIIVSGGTVTSKKTTSPGGTIYIADSGTATAARLEITGGTVENTASSFDGYPSAVYNASTGAVTISGGTVTAASNYAVLNDSTGAVTISGGTVSVTESNGRAVFNYRGTVNITGGTVSATGGSGYAVYNSSSSVSAVRISGGTVESTGNGGRAVYNDSNGRIVVSGTARITSANTNPAQGTVYSSNGTLDILGGTVENTAANGNAVYNTSAYEMSLGGNPTITGIISTMTGLTLSNFNPGTKVYSLNFISAPKGNAVTSGAVYPSNFTLANSVVNGVSVSLVVKGSDLVLQAGNGYAVSGTAPYTITKGTGTMPFIQEAIDSIKTQSGGAACTIRFGDGTNVLDIGGGDVTPITFDSWTGLVTLTGKLTSASTSTAGIIRLNNGTSIDNKAELTATSSGYLIFNNSTGTVTVSGGTVSATSGAAVYNNSTGTVTISGGTVQATSGNGVYNNNNGKIIVSGTTAKVTAASTYAGSAAIYLYNGTLEISGGTVENTGIGRAVYNYSSGTVTISGGTVSATTGTAVYNGYTGKITVSGATTKITSANTDTAQGTIFIASSGTATAARLEMTGGTVENTSATTGNAIRNNSTGAVDITGGTVKATGTSAYSIYNNSTGVVTVGPSATITGARYP